MMRGVRGITPSKDPLHRLAAEPEPGGVDVCVDSEIFSAVVKVAGEAWLLTPGFSMLSRVALAAPPPYNLDCARP
jgi:hypothetical protein